MVARKNTALPDSNRIKRLQWYFLLAFLAGGTGILVLSTFGYLSGLPNPIPTNPPP